MKHSLGKSNNRLDTEKYQCKEQRKGYHQISCQKQYNSIDSRETSYKYYTFSLGPILFHIFFITLGFYIFIL